MRSHYLRLAAVVGLLVSLSGLGGCVSTVTPRPSQAVLDARASVAAAKARATAQAACPTAPELQKLVVEFAFQDAGLDATAGRQLDAAAALLRCDPALRLTLTAEADYHGPPDSQRALIAQRLATVRQYLVSAGAAEAQLAAAPGAAGAWTLLARGRDW